MESRRAIQPIASTAAPKATTVQREAPRQEDAVQKTPVQALASVPIDAAGSGAAGGSADLADVADVAGVADAAPHSSSASAHAAPRSSARAARRGRRDPLSMCGRGISDSVSREVRSASGTDLPVAVAKGAGPLVYSAPASAARQRGLQGSQAW